jgi:hypothetical protein
MRILVVGGVALALAACSGKSPDEKAMQNAELANYTPPFVMSRLDYGGVIERRFRRLDVNNDDRLEPSEIAPRNREWVMRFDADKDGRISVEEWSRGMLSRFDRQDLNHDGTVTSDERERAREMHDTDLPTPADEPGNATTTAGATSGTAPR